jgi:type II secretory pathway component PulF
MEAAVQNLTDLNALSPYEVLEAFFRVNSRDEVWDKCFGLLKVWAKRPGDIKQYSDEEIALFLDQLIDLVAAASTLHEANKALVNSQGEQHHG